MMALSSVSKASGLPKTEFMWSLGLGAKDQAVLAKVAGKGYELRSWGPGDVPATLNQIRANSFGDIPMLIWIPSGVWQRMPPEVRQAYQQWEAPLRILVLEPHSHQPSAKDVSRQGFLTSVRAPLTEESVNEVLQRAAELSGLYADIISMTKEILLERELLSRKTEQLTFLNRILTRTAESLDPKTILNRALEEMSLLLPLKAVQAAFWRPGTLMRDEDGFPTQVDADLYVSPDMDPEEQTAWVAYLLEEVRKLESIPLGGYDITLLESGSGLEQVHVGLPTDRNALVLPLRSGSDAFGLLALVPEVEVRLAKDQAETLKAAVTHLGLTLKNALLYREAQFKAELDGLTRLHNRQGFDRRLAEELARHRRYGQELSLLLIDLDHFKAVNDTHGHEAGDLVLREVGRILADSLRTTDFPCRYGGEEFAVILPHTPPENAAALAERLRQTIADTIFHFGTVNFQVTTSVGVGAMCGSGEDLLTQADRALYAAKNGGRNQVCLAEEIQQAQQEAACQQKSA